MTTIADPGHAGQGTDPPERRSRCAALKVTPEEARHIRVATRKVAKARGGFLALAVATGIPVSTVYYAARPNGRASLAFAVRLAEAAKVPVEVILTGKLAVQPPIIGRAAA
jgi:hypothetical protein